MKFVRKFRFLISSKKKKSNTITIIIDFLNTIYGLYCELKITIENWSCGPTILVESNWLWCSCKEASFVLKSDDTYNEEMIQIIKRTLSWNYLYYNTNNSYTNICYDINMNYLVFSKPSKLSYRSAFLKFFPFLRLGVSFGCCNIL